MNITTKALYLAAAAVLAVCAGTAVVLGGTHAKKDATLLQWARVKRSSLPESLPFSVCQWSTKQPVGADGRAWNEGPG